MDIAALIDHAINTTDTLAQVASGLYIAIAVFSGEQVATALKGQRPQIRINPRRYIEYLNVPRASVALMLLVTLQPLYDTDIFPGVTLQPLKMICGLAALAGITWWLYRIIGDTLIHRDIEKRFEYITGSTSRLIAWALEQEVSSAKRGTTKIPGRVEQLKLITTLFEHENDVNLERYMLEQLTKRLHEIVASPASYQKVAPSLLSALRALHDNLEKRPMLDTRYYDTLFDLSHNEWHAARTERKNLHKHGIRQLSGILSAISKKLLIRSATTDFNPLYDYAARITPFLTADAIRAKDYATIMQPLINEHVTRSKLGDSMDKDYIIEFQAALKNALADTAANARSRNTSAERGKAFRR